MAENVFKEKLLLRLSDIAGGFAASGHGLALLALGSSGTDTARIDAYSDLDLFAVVEAGCREQYLDDLAWVAAGSPVAFAFRNTPDGYKILFDDGIYLELAVLEPGDLAGLPYQAGRVVWASETGSALPWPAENLVPGTERTEEWILGEILTNLFVGLGRYHRGERVAAFRMVQVYAVDRLMELADIREPQGTTGRDRFGSERRFETRHPAWQQRLASWMPGCDATPAAARAILSFLESMYPINDRMRRAILDLAA